MMLKMMNPMGSMPVSIDITLAESHDVSLLQSVPGTGDKDKEEDKGMTIEEKKEAERQRNVSPENLILPDKSSFS